MREQFGLACSSAGQTPHSRLMRNPGSTLGSNDIGCLWYGTSVRDALPLSQGADGGNRQGRYSLLVVEQRPLCETLCLAPRTEKRLEHSSYPSSFSFSSFLGASRADINVAIRPKQVFRVVPSSYAIHSNAVHAEEMKLTGAACNPGDPFVYQESLPSLA